MLKDKNIYEYDILNYWNDQDDLYVNYIVKNLETYETVNTISYFNVSDLNCDYNIASQKEIKHSLYKLIKESDGIEFKLPKVSTLSNLLKYIYDFVCDSESNMCHIDYKDWEDIKEDNNFTEEDIDVLRKEIVKYNLNDYITIDDKEYKICGYGGLQTMFNDDRGNNEYER